MAINFQRTSITLASVIEEWTLLQSKYRSQLDIRPYWDLAASYCVANSILNFLKKVTEYEDNQIWLNGMFTEAMEYLVKPTPDNNQHSEWVTQRNSYYYKLLLINSLYDYQEKVFVCKYIQ